MRRLKLKIDDEEVTLWAQKIKGTTWIHYNGKTFTYEPKKKMGQGQLESSTSEPGLILAPMPGKILKVNFKVGDEVKQDDVILIMEAMKMEYSLKSDIDGTLKALNCDEGQQVNLGASLAKVES